MRIELKDENQEEPKQIDENDIHNKHESDLTKKEKRQLEKEKLAGMGLGAKLGYIWAYYKPQMAAIVGVIVLIFAAKDIYDNAQIETALTMMVIDSYGMKQAGAEEAVENILGIQDDPYQIVTVDESLRTEGDGAALESYSQMSFTTKVAARAIDVLVGSEIYIDSFANKEEYFANFKFNENARMLSVIVHDNLDGNTLFVGHVGVLVPAKDGYLFVEGFVDRA